MSTHRLVVQVRPSTMVNAPFIGRRVPSHAVTAFLRRELHLLALFNHAEGIAITIRLHPTAVPPER